MKTIACFISGARFLLVIPFLVGIIFNRCLPAFPQSLKTESGVSAASVPTAKVQSATRFQASTFPVEASLQVRVVFENPTSAPVSVSVYTAHGDVLYHKVHTHTQKYNGKLDFSQFPEGEYWVEVKSTASGMEKEQHFSEAAYQIRSQPNRSLAAFSKNLQKELYKRRVFLSSK